MRYVVLGGGVAGVCCAEELARCCARRASPAPRPAGADRAADGSSTSSDQPVDEQDEVILVSSSSVIKGVTNVVHLSRNIEEFQVEETCLKDLQQRHHGRLRVLQAHVRGLDTDSKELLLADGGRLHYDKLCISAGARPKALHCKGADDPRVITLRDTESVEAFAAALQHCRRLVLVGNGGIALELVGAVTARTWPAAGQGGGAGAERQPLELVWVLKHGHIGDAFFDTDAAHFLLTRIASQQQDQRLQGQDGAEPSGAPSGGARPGCSSSAPAGAQDPAGLPIHGGGSAAAASSTSHAGQDTPEPRPPPSDIDATGPPEASTSGSVSLDQGSSGLQRALGHAAGPKWTDALRPGAGEAEGGRHARVVLEFTSHIQDISAGGSMAEGAEAAAAEANGRNGDDDGEAWPIYVTLDNGKVMGADLVVCAIGVEPNTAWLPASLRRAPDGGLSVDRHLQTSAPGVYAAGDCCTVERDDMPPHWFQMRLWTQARLMGTYAAHCMAGVSESLGSSFSLELFTHVTRFLGLKVVLLGLYNGQRLGGEPEQDMVLYSRVQEGGPSPTFVRVLLLRGRMQGAVLIGETDLEETFENLILDGLDLSAYGPEILDPDVELDHMFD